MALFKILKGAEENLSSQKKREGFAYFTTDSNDFYIDISSDEGDVAGERKQLNANRAHYIVSKKLYENADYDKLYIDGEQISLGRTRGESDYENGLKNAGLNSIAVGINISATGEASQAFGYDSIASGYASHAEGGYGTASGDYSHTEGEFNKATGEYSHAEGSTNVASGMASHVEGMNNEASGDYSHAEGDSTLASGNYSHAEGCATKATNFGAHAEGEVCIASGQASHAEGLETLASSDNQHVQGKYNIEDKASKYAHIIGNGEENARSNAHTLDWNGNAWFAGDAYVGGANQEDGSKLSTENYVQEYSLPLISDESSNKYIIGIDAGGIYIIKK